MATRRQRRASKSNKKKSDMQKLEAFLKGLKDSGLAEDLRGFVSERKQGAGGLSAAAQQGGLGVGTEAPTSQFDKPSKWSLQDRGPEAIRGRETIRDSTNEAFRRGLGEQAREETGIEAPRSKSKLDRLKGMAGRAAGWLGSGRGGIQGRDVQRQQPAPEAVKPRVGLMEPTSWMTQRPTAQPPAQTGASPRTGPQQGAAGVDPSRPDEPAAAGGAVTAAQRKKLTDSARFSSQMPAYGGALRGSTPPAATPPPAPRETRGWESGLTPPAAAPAARAKRGGEVTQRPQNVDPRQGRDYQTPTQAAPQPPLTRDRTRLSAATGGVGKPLPRDTRGGPNMMTPVGPVSREARRPKETFGTEVPAAKPPLTKRQEGKRISMGFGQGEDLSLMQSGDPSQLKGSADITGAAQRAGLTGAKGRDGRMYGAGDKYGGGQARFNVEEKQMREQIDTLFQKAQGGDRAARQELSKIHADLTSQADRAEGGPRIRPGQRQLETTVGGSGAQKLPQVIVNRILKDYSQQFRNVRAERTQGRRAAK